jgi:hypothetical protein
MPFFITLSISDARAMSSMGFEFRTTRSAKWPGAIAPIFGPISPPNVRAAFAVALRRMSVGVRPASFIN